MARTWSSLCVSLTVILLKCTEDAVLAALSADGTRLDIERQSYNDDIAILRSLGDGGGVSKCLLQALDASYVANFHT